MSAFLASAALGAVGSFMNGRQANDAANQQAWANYYNSQLRYGQEIVQIQQEQSQDARRLAQQRFDIQTATIQQASAARASAAQRGVLGLSTTDLINDAYRQGGVADTRVTQNFDARTQQRGQDVRTAGANMYNAITQGNYQARVARQNANFNMLGGVASSIGNAYINTLRIPT